MLHGQQQSVESVEAADEVIERRRGVPRHDELQLAWRFVAEDDGLLVVRGDDGEDAVEADIREADGRGLGLGRLCRTVLCMVYGCYGDARRKDNTRKYGCGFYPVAECCWLLLIL